MPTDRRLSLSFFSVVLLNVQEMATLGPLNLLWSAICNQNRDIEEIDGNKLTFRSSFTTDEERSTKPQWGIFGSTAETLLVRHEYRRIHQYLKQDRKKPLKYVFVKGTKGLGSPCLHFI